MAHYIYTTPSVQYKRLFELAQSQRNQSHAAYERPFCRIDRNKRSGQDTVGFALAVG
ncbi:transposase [Pseudomonas sp. IT-P294]